MLACLFDWDGVIIDSSVQHEKSWEMLAAEENLPLYEGHFVEGFGMRNEVIIPTLYKWSQDPAEIGRLAVRKEELYRELVKADGISALPGVEPFLKMLNDAGIPCVVGSSTPRINIDAVIETLGFATYFKGYVTAGDVSHGKPDPEVFLLAAGIAGVPPAQCVVFEDALMGIEAGKAGGMAVVAVTTTNPRGKMGMADAVVDRLDELSVADLDALVSKSTPGVGKPERSS